MQKKYTTLSHREILITLIIIFALGFIIYLTYNNYLRGPINDFYLSRQDQTKVGNIDRIAAEVSDKLANLNDDEIRKLNHKIHISIPSTSENCKNIKLPNLKSPFTYSCTTGEKSWIPIIDVDNAAKNIDGFATDLTYYGMIASGTNKSNLEYTIFTTASSKKHKNNLYLTSGGADHLLWKALSMTHGFSNDNLEDTAKSLRNFTGTSSAIFFEIPNKNFDLAKQNFIYIPKSNWEYYENFTILANININSLELGHNRISEKARDYQNRNWTLEINPSGYISFTADGKERGQSAIALVSTGQKVEPGKDYTVAATFDGTWLKLFLNGEIVGSKNIEDTPKNNYIEITFGKAFDYGPKYFNGIIHSISIFDRALMNQEIKNFSY